MSKIRVVVVDDSALIRSLLKSIIESNDDMECLGMACDPLEARELIRETNPDVITLDVEMPKMDGLDFLERLMRLRPTPVIMISTLTERGAETTLRALELGAVDFVAKPRLGVSQGMEQLQEEISDKLRATARARVARRAPAPPPERQAAGVQGARVKPLPIAYSRASTERLIAIGASTGGTEAVRAVLMDLPADCPPVLIVQHMPPGFTRSFAERLNSLCKMHVKEAVDGERVVPGHAYVAPGGCQMSVRRSGAYCIIVVDDGPPVNRHKPSVDVMFRSVARSVGVNAVGVMLTGMGRDGADGMREMRDAGAYNFAQNEETCVVYGMPREAVLVGAVDQVLPLKEIAGQLLHRIGVSRQVTTGA